LTSSQRQAGGHTWKLYTATFQHNPVDLAFRVTPNGTLLVGMVSASDEREVSFVLTQRLRHSGADARSIA